MMSHLREQEQKHSLRPPEDHVHVYIQCSETLYPLALSGQCIVDCQQCTVGSGPVAGLRSLHVSVDH